MIPDSGKDQHGNAVVERNGSKVDPKTGYPYEIWLKEPRMEFVLVPAGEFMMGSPRPEEEQGRTTDEGPLHRVHITKPFYMGKCEVTVAQFRGFAQTAHHKTDAEVKGKARVFVGGKASLVTKEGANWRSPNFEQTDAEPVVCASWDDAEAFCKAMGERSGVRIVLPTEAQWEYACRAGTQTRYSHGDDPDYSELPKHAWCRTNSKKKTHPVGQKLSNLWGLHDMHGNACEWCLDGKRTYSAAAETDPRGDDPRRVVRGGSFGGNVSFLRSAYRIQHARGIAINTLGFRVSIELPES